VGKRLRVWPEATRVHDLTKGIPHEADSVDVIYSSHTLEHFGRQAGEDLIRECFRVLRPGGMVRIIVPDLRRLAQSYVDGDREVFGERDELLADAFASGIYSHPHPASWVRQKARRLLRADDGGHKWMYDEETLTARLRDAGFVDIIRVERGQGRDAEVAALDLRPGYHLHVEAVKPGSLTR
jgi:predicted SAM-dependent methyltransferase